MPKCPPLPRLSLSLSLTLSSLSIRCNQTTERAAAEWKRLWLAHIRPEGPGPVSSVAPHLETPAGPAAFLQSSTTTTAPQRALSIYTTHTQTHVHAHTLDKTFFFDMRALRYTCILYINWNIYTHRQTYIRHRHFYTHTHTHPNAHSHTQFADTHIKLKHYANLQPEAEDGTLLGLMPKSLSFW